MSRPLGHPAETVWPWLTDPARLAQWSPVVPDAAFDAVGARRVRENPDDESFPGDVLVVDPPHELVHRWGDNVLRWLLTPSETGCVLTLEQSMPERGPAAMNAAGWQVCLDVLEPNVDGIPTPRVVGPAALQHGWEALRDRYAQLLG